ncbi:HAD hydrolase-like protein [Sporolactobacillus shoreicorticis]|uniref:HAD hydrolase-like protein n=1 Tax=Sporolactobacillus shoreicorticis TaxID=1923877 RepID=A0ABW5S2B9_9BACL|nr:HAD hydrolase-like protein [Sporolactobacillus shoreicorticis]MCO7126429.1 HAD hydrolase-like protein [Sporolactobacillus shoreicorticis]
MAELLTFDCYGTLIDTAPFWKELKKIAEENGIDKSSLVTTYVNYEDRLMYGEGLFTVYSDIIYKTLQYCEMELNSGKLTDQYERLIKVHKELSPFPEVITTLKSLKSKGYQTSVMSNSDWDIMRSNLESLKNDFDSIYLAEDLHAYKPQLSFFEQVQNELRTNQHVHIAAGFWWDMVPAQRMNWRRIWVNRQAKKGLQNCMPYSEVKTLDEVMNYL